jgi:sulfite exporter TauE/SafE
LISTNPKDYKELLIAFTALLVLYFLLRNTSIFNGSLAGSGNFASFPVVFVVGLTAGVSTCMALVGGIVFALSTRFAEEHPNLNTAQKIKPHLFFNLGRIIFFVILGALIGFLGSLIHFSTPLLALLTVLVSIITLLLGLQITGIFPVLEKVKLTLPKHIYGLVKRKDQSTYSHATAIILGGLTFFLPCGFTQAIQFYAVGTGSALSGALTMGVFALGTAPGLLGVGGLSSLINAKSSKIFFKFAGLVVISLAVFNISNASNLAGISISLPKKSPQNVIQVADTKDPNVKIVNNVQVVTMLQKSSGYVPNTFTIKKGIPVQWIITSESSASCASSIVSSQLSLRRQLQVGENIVEFTPTKEGIIRFSCSMGMYRGSFNVI